MEFEFKLADLGEGITEAEIRSWLVKPGERVEEHQPVVEVETDKAVVELPTPRAGQVVKLHNAEGEIVPVGAALLTIRIGAEKEPPEIPKAQPQRKESFGIVGQLPEAEAQPPKMAKPAAEIKALPSVRTLAKELGVALEALTGSGPDGSISAEDVRQAATRSALPKQAVPSENGSYRKPMRAVRRAIARNLLKAQQLTAFVTNMDEFDVTRLWELKLRETGSLAERDLPLTFLPFFMKAVQHALVEFPRFNAQVEEESSEVIFHTSCHMGIAVDTIDGLMVPVLKNIGQKSIIDLAEELKLLSERARDRSITPDEMQGSTITVTNFGSSGGHYATPILNYPNVAILGCGRIRPKPWVHQGEIAIRQILPLSLTFDHRVSDGAEACRFLSRIGHYLEDPGLLFIESV